MKSYKEYMDAVHLRPEIRDRIVKGMKHTRQPRQGYRLLAVAACIAIAVLAIWSLPPFIGRQVARLNPGPADGPLEEIELAGGTLYFAKVSSASIPIEKIRGGGLFYEDIPFSSVEQIFGGTLPIPGNMSIDSAKAGFLYDGSLADCSIEFRNGTARVRIFFGAAGKLEFVSEDFQKSTINGTEVYAGYEESELYMAYFQLDQRLVLIEAEPSQAMLANTLNSVLASGLNFSGIAATAIPDWRYDTFTLAEAQEDLDYGRYVPGYVPTGFRFSSAYRIVNQDNNSMLINYESGTQYIELSISRASPEDSLRIVNVSSLETYDVGMYPIPWADSVPEDIRQIFSRPVFRYEDLTLNVMRARAYQVQDAGDLGQRMNFSVLQGDVVIEVRVKGSTPEAVQDMLSSIQGLK